MKIHLLDDSLQVEIFYEQEDEDFKDNICVRIQENCTDDERLFRAKETNIFVTPKQACQLAKALAQAAECSSG